MISAKEARKMTEQCINENFQNELNDIEKQIKLKIEAGLFEVTVNHPKYKFWDSIKEKLIENGYSVMENVSFCYIMWGSP